MTAWSPGFITVSPSGMIGVAAHERAYDYVRLEAIRNRTKHRLRIAPQAEHNHRRARAAATTIIPDGETVIKPGDHAVIVTARAVSKDLTLSLRAADDHKNDSPFAGAYYCCAFAVLLLPAADRGGCTWRSVLGFIVTIVISAAAAFVLTRFKPESTDISAREGFVIVGMGWILLSAIGALAICDKRGYPEYIDALFETASGLTTTGATIMTDIEGHVARRHVLAHVHALDRRYGRAGVHLAVMPMNGAHLDHLMRAEVRVDGRQARPACAADGEDTLSHIFRADYHRGGAAPLRRHEQL